MLTIEPIHPDFGATVTGIDLSADFDDEATAALREAIDMHSLLHFPEQEMTDEAQFALTRCLGEPEPNHVHFGKTGEVIYFGTIGNVIDADTKRDESDPLTRNQKGNNLWHSDSSFRLVPSYVSILHAYEVPGEGGETEYASQRAAYARLDPSLQAEIDELQVLHDYVFSRTQVAPVDPNHAASLPPIPQRLVRTNPSNGAKNYYVGSHARSIVGWSGIDSRRLIDELNAGATRPEGVYSHRWSSGDTVIYDNRCMLHRGVGYDADRWRRYMRQTRVQGQGPTLDE
ncbi:TauD/TfdA dioxygenase family protein [Candidatus Poriferisodalis sp.]|uniref:TauD/TfdA dioxygenase family protein n=1 Tax=Candidatus Poriferisodalis sp. TaxID=3101277 RepID=UPI003B5BB3D0